MGSGGGGSSTQTTTSEPWSQQKPYLEKGFSEAGKLYDQGPADYFPGQTYVDQSAQTIAGLEGQQNRAYYGSPVQFNASDYAANTLGGNSDNPYSAILNAGTSGQMDTASGKFLNSNPYLDDIYGSASRQVTQDFENSVLPGIAAQFGSSGGAGGALHGLALSDAGGKLTDSLSSLAANIYGGDYAAERDRMTNAQQGLTSTGANLYGTGVNERLSALGLSPDIAAAEYADFDKMRDVGAAYEDFAGKQLEDEINRFNYNENKQLASLQDYLALISGNYGGTSVSRSNTSSGGSGLSTGLGALTTIASLFG